MGMPRGEKTDSFSVIGMDLYVHRLLSSSLALRSSYKRMIRVPVDGRVVGDEWSVHNIYKHQVRFVPGDSRLDHFPHVERFVDRTILRTRSTQRDDQMQVHLSSGFSLGFTLDMP